MSMAAQRKRVMATFVGAVVLATCSFLVRPVWAYFDLQVAVTAFHSSSATDPWGSSWGHTPYGGVYSYGPNGRDDRGLEDDVHILWRHHGIYGRAQAWHWSPWPFRALAAGLLLVGCVLSRRAGGGGIFDRFGG